MITFAETKHLSMINTKLSGLFLGTQNRHLAESHRFEIQPDKSQTV